MLQGEMTAHLEGETSSKTIQTEQGPMQVDIPRDRNATFEPILLPKHVRRFGKIDEQIIAMYSRGMSTRDIEAFVRDMYGLEISPDYVSAVTQCVLEGKQRKAEPAITRRLPSSFLRCHADQNSSSSRRKEHGVHIALGI